MGKLTEENSDKLQALVESGALDRPKKPAMTNTTDISGELAKIIGVGIGITRYGDEWIISGDRTSLNEAIQALIDRAYQDGYHKRNREIIDEISLGYQKLSNTTGAKAGVIDETMQG